MINIKEYITLDLTFEVPPMEPKDLFAFVANTLKQKGYITDVKKLVADLLAREKKGSTGIGDAIGVPHAFIPELQKPLVITLFLRKAIDFHAPDGQPVRVLFFVLAPEQRRDEYLKILANLATILHDNVVKRKVFV